MDSLKSLFNRRPSISELIEFHRLRDRDRLLPYIDQEDILPLLKHRISILILTDGITFNDADFGLSMAIAALEENFSSAVYFEVKKATREGEFSFTPNPPADTPHYTGFRFNSLGEDGDLIINQFDQIWCFGLRPGNGAFVDTEVTSDLLYATDAELAELSCWMNERQGGVFATGDHAHLGASMCHRIPRVATMRKWLMADNPPTFVGYDRFDTNRPRNPGETHIPDSAQTDAMPQPVEWVPEYWQRIGLFRIEKVPHPIMCAGELGPIDVLPDHQHEGQVVEDNQLDLTQSFSFMGENGQVYSGPEYPQTGRKQTKPKIIARAHTLSQPPYTFEKGPTPARSFGLVGIYDGLPEGVGRVVVDSTWHHWLNINLRDIAADTTSNGYSKIKSYFRNVGLWLANRESRYAIFRNAVWNSFYTYQASQELASGSVFEVGKSLRNILKHLLSPCLVTEIIIDFLPPILAEEFRVKMPIDPDPCLTCPPLELFEDVILGEIALTLHRVFIKTEHRRLKHYRTQLEPDLKAINLAITDGVEQGLVIAHLFYANELEKGRVILSALKKAQPPAAFREVLL